MMAVMETRRLNSFILLGCIIQIHLVKGLYKCSPDWEKWQDRCYNISTETLSFYMAAQKCAHSGHQLWHIDSEDENNFLSGKLTKTYWINRRFRNYQWVVGYTSEPEPSNVYKKTNLNPHSYFTCVVWSGINAQWSISSCEAQRRYICYKTADCADGFYGEECNEKCHCASGGCDRPTGVCSSGCKYGWTGEACNKKKKKVQGLYYCLNSEEKGRIMVFRANQFNVNYREVTAIDKGGNPVPTCDRTAFNLTKSGIAALTIHEDNKQFIPDCGAEKVATDTAKWRFHFGEFQHTQSKYDVIFEVTCNFSAADTLQRSSDVNNGKLQGITTSLDKSELSVGLRLTDPVSQVELLSAKIGNPLRLHLDYTQSQADFGVKRIAPYSCEASTPDGKNHIPFVGEDGCTSENAQVIMVAANGSNYVSHTFEAFAFPGQEHVVFSCHIEICFSEDDPLCKNRCENYKTTISADHNNTSPSPAVRKRRNVGVRLRVTDN